MKRYLIFVGVGSIFATVEEFLTVVVIRHDVGAYVFTLLILFPVFLTLVWLSRRYLIDQLVSGPRTRDLWHYFSFGFTGLMMEWFLMNLTPWSNPAANPLVILVFQLGMFSFWATVSFAPWLFVDEAESKVSTRRLLLRFYVPYFGSVYAVAFAAPETMKFVTIIPLVIFGHLFLNVYYVLYFRRTAPPSARSAALAPLD